LDQICVPVVVKGRKKSGIVVVFEECIVIGRESEKKDLWHHLTHFPMGSKLKVGNILYQNGLGLGDSESRSPKHEPMGVEGKARESEIFSSVLCSASGLFHFLLVH
jgi:hypothetical protein